MFLFYVQRRQCVGIRVCRKDLLSHNDHHTNVIVMADSVSDIFKLSRELKERNIFLDGPGKCYHRQATALCKGDPFIHAMSPAIRHAKRILGLHSEANLRTKNSITQLTRSWTQTIIVQVQISFLIESFEVLFSTACGGEVHYTHLIYQKALLVTKLSIIKDSIVREVIPLPTPI